MSNDFCMDIDRDCPHIANMREQLRMSDAALTEAIASIIQMREQLATITKQRDLAVSALQFYMDNGICKATYYNVREALSAIEESEAGK